MKRACGCEGLGPHRRLCGGGTAPALEELKRMWRAREIVFEVVRLPVDFGRRAKRIGFSEAS